MGAATLVGMFTVCRSTGGTLAEYSESTDIRKNLQEQNVRTWMIATKLVSINVIEFV